MDNLKYAVLKEQDRAELEEQELEGIYIAGS